MLPDFNTNFSGYTQPHPSPKIDDQHVLLLGVERFAIPEILFHPSDIGR